jgi:4-hydroxy-tetrahydrodipicolinate reductase
MRIALIGYGKMGREIEAAAIQSGHDVVLKINSQNSHQLTIENLKKADVAIEFSRPHLAINHAMLCLDAGIPIIIGTTGWYNQMEQLENYTLQKNGTVVYASNFSTGVNIFFMINEMLAKLMTPHHYQIWIEEAHHLQKIDKPSGTAITLATDILKHNHHYRAWSLHDNHHTHSDTDTDTDTLPIYCQRVDEVTGYHSVSYRSQIDTIEIIHNAFNRKGFALGAITAAQLALKTSGFFNFKDLLQLTTK